MPTFAANDADDLDLRQKDSVALYSPDRTHERSGRQGFVTLTNLRQASGKSFINHCDERRAVAILIGDAAAVEDQVRTCRNGLGRRPDRSLTSLSTPATCSLAVANPLEGQDG